MSPPFRANRLRLFTGILLIVVFVAIGIGLLAEDQRRLGALMLALALFRGGFVIAQYNEEKSTTPV